MTTEKGYASSDDNAIAGQPPTAIVRFTVGISAAAIALFVLLLWLISADQADDAEDGIRTILVVGVMFVSGGLGASLYSLRGLIKHSSANDHSPHYNLWYYLSPLAGGISGMIVFFLLLGGALTLNVSAPRNEAVSGLTGIGLAPYIAFALLAGYAAREFMLKMKDLADSLFALRGGGE